MKKLLLGLLFFLTLIESQTTIRGRTSMRGNAMLGAVSCDAFVTVCQGPPVTLTSADIISGNPIQILGAQGVNTAILLVALEVQYLPGSMPFSMAWATDTFYGTQPGSLCNNVNLDTSTTTAQMTGGACEAENNAATISNVALFVVNDNGPVTGGNGSLVFTPIYTVITVQ